MPRVSNHPKGKVKVTRHRTIQSLLPRILPRHQLISTLYGGFFGSVAPLWLDRMGERTDLGNPGERARALQSACPIATLTVCGNKSLSGVMNPASPALVRALEGLLIIASFEGLFLRLPNRYEC